MYWRLSHRFDSRALPLANAHYNRQSPDSPQFVPPGRCLVLLTKDADALWVTSWPDYAQHRWLGAWVNTLFRNESGILASALIQEAVAITRWYFTVTPALGFITFVDASKIRHKRDPGRCYVRAGWTRLKETTQGGLTVLQQLPEQMPAPMIPIGGQVSLF